MIASLSSWIFESRGTGEPAHVLSGMMAAAKSLQPVAVEEVRQSKRKHEESDHPLTTPLPEMASSTSKRQKLNVESQPVSPPLGSSMTEVPAIEAQEEPAASSSPFVEAQPKHSEEAFENGTAKALIMSRHIIRTQLDNAVLAKHDELRRVDQELARCQASLDQLRRCHLIPYPTSMGMNGDVTNGVGPAIARPGVANPQWAPPFGVTEGPYARHYAKWLISDPAFDGAQSDFQIAQVSSRGVTRSSYSDGPAPSSRSRNQRGSLGQSLQALPSGYNQTKETQGPAVLKRADGQTVKLVCLDCQRQNFSSVQGFINHCRIAHRREYKSHEEAAVASGRPLAPDDIVGVPKQENSPSRGFGTPAPLSSSAPVIAAAMLARTRVHPQIYEASPDKAAYLSLQSRIVKSIAMFEAGELPGIAAIPRGMQAESKQDEASPAGFGRLVAIGPPNNDFVASPAAPHLSALLKVSGCNQNLHQMITESTQSLEEDDNSESEIEEPTIPQTPYVTSHDGSSDVSAPARKSVRAVMSPAPCVRPSSHKGPDARMPGAASRVPFTNPFIDTAITNQDSARRLHTMANEILPTPSEINAMPGSPRHPSSSFPPSLEHSPNTIASNSAPSLVSDDDDYDDHDGAESEMEDDDWEGEEAGGDRAEIVDVEAVRKNSTVEELSRRREEKERHVTFVDIHEKN